jgi:HK97 family phage prohead protease
MLKRKASVSPSSFNATDRTFEAVISTGAPVARRDSKGPYTERLDLSAIKPESLIGVAVLVEHRSGDFEAHVGTVISGRFEGDQLIAAIKITTDPSADSVVRKIEEGILNSLSIGYGVSSWKETIDGGQRVRTAVEWKIHEVSLVGIPADTKSKIRKAENMIQATRTEIRNLTRAAKLPPEFADALIDGDTELEAARTAIADEVSKRTIKIPVITTVANDDPAIVLERRTAALASRIMGRKPDDAAREYVNDRLVDHARGLLTLRGETTRGMNDEQTLTRAAQHTTSDFPNLLQGVGQRVLLAGYEASPQVMKSLARKGTRTDFRPGSTLQTSGIGLLEKVSESGEIKHGTISESKEAYELDTFAKIFAISRKAIINDDLGAFKDWGLHAGRAASETEGNLLMGLLTQSNGLGPLMYDNKRLFHADHGNLLAGSALSVASLSAARLGMRTQKGIDGKTGINIVPKHLVVGPTLETTAEQLLATLNAGTTADVNPFSGKLELLVDSRITDGSWYVFADPATSAVIEYSYLSGAEGPQIATREGWDVLGMEFRAVLDFGCGALDWRGAVRNPGV